MTQCILDSHSLLNLVFTSNRMNVSKVSSPSCSFAGLASLRDDPRCVDYEPLFCWPCRRKAVATDSEHVGHPHVSRKRYVLASLLIGLGPINKETYNEKTDLFPEPVACVNVLS